MPIIATGYAVECDWCQDMAYDGDGVEPSSPGFETEAHAAATAKKRGWFLNEDAEEWACPDCRPKAEAECAEEDDDAE